MSRLDLKYDLTGKRFGRLVVTSRAPNHNKRIMWNCLCDCGNTKTICYASLTKGDTQSCGCLQKERVSESHFKNLKNLRFGRLLVLRQSKYKPRISECVGWLCICDCGNYIILNSNRLLTGNSKSCGCYRKECRITHGQSKVKEYINTLTKKRREQKILYDSLWNLDMERSLRILQPACVVCGITEQEHQEKYNTSLHIDHVLPLSKGNGLKPGNAVVLCVSCNSIKNSKLLKELSENMRNKIVTAAKTFNLWWKENRLD